MKFNSGRHTQCSKPWSACHVTSGIGSKISMTPTIRCRGKNRANKNVRPGWSIWHNTGHCSIAAAGYLRTSASTCFSDSSGRVGGPRVGFLSLLYDFKDQPGRTFLFAQFLPLHRIFGVIEILDRMPDVTWQALHGFEHWVCIHELNFIEL